MPQIAAGRWATSVTLQPGERHGPGRPDVEMQHLVIKSTIDWVLAREEHVVVVPEAWKFILQASAAVKLAAEAFIRQVAGLGNYLGSTTRTLPASRS